MTGVHSYCNHCSQWSPGCVAVHIANGLEYFHDNMQKSLKWGGGVKQETKKREAVSFDKRE